MARDCVIEIVSESKEIKAEEVPVVDPLTTSEEMLLGMARAIIARNETQKKQAELLAKEVEKEDGEPNGTTGLIREKRVEELEEERRQAADASIRAATEAGRSHIGVIGMRR